MFAFRVFVCRYFNKLSAVVGSGCGRESWLLSIRRLLYLVPEFPSQTHAFFWREALALRGLGLEVVFVSTSRPSAGEQVHSFVASAKGETRYVVPPGVGTVCRLLLRPDRLFSALRYVLGLKATGWKDRLKVLAGASSAYELVLMSGRGDHVHIHSCANAAHLGAMAYVMGGPTYSLTLHGDLSVYGVDHEMKALDALLMTAVTRPLTDQLREIGVPDEKIEMITMGVDTRQFSMREPVAHRPGCLRVVTVARLNPTKGHRYLLEAIRALVDEGYDIRYRVAGEGPARSEIEEAVVRLGLGDRVDLLGAVSQERVAEELSEADAFVLPSFGKGEAAPVSVMEAMARGVPVVVSRIGGTPDMIEDGVDGLLCDQKDVSGLAGSLRRLADEPGLGLSLARSARERVLREFDDRVLAQRLRDAIAARLEGA